MRVLNYYILTAFLTIFICYFDMAAQISSLFIVLVLALIRHLDLVVYLVFSHHSFLIKSDKSVTGRFAPDAYFLQIEQMHGR